jgi:hypothetical protein
VPCYGWVVAVAGALFTVAVDEYLKAGMHRRAKERKVQAKMAERHTELITDIRVLREHVSRLEGLMLKTHERPRHRLVDPDVAHCADLPPSPRFGLAAQTLAHGVGVGVGIGFGLNRSTRTSRWDWDWRDSRVLPRQPPDRPSKCRAWPKPFTRLI